MENERTGFEDICSYLWDKLKKGQIESYYRNLVEEDLVLVAEFAESEKETDIAGSPLHKMIIITFLGRMSETIELRDL